MKRWKVKEVLRQGEEQDEVIIMGWVRTRRDSKGGFSFLEINDGSCLKNLQVIADHSIDSFDLVSGKLHTGSCVGVTGELFHQVWAKEHPLLVLSYHHHCSSYRRV